MGENPYSPPQSALESSRSGFGGGAGAWREGRVLIVEHGAQLPARCVKCNRPETVRIQRAFTWHPGWVYVLFLAGVLVYLIVMLILRKTSKIAIPLCADHARRRRNTLLVAWALVLLGIGACVGGPSMDEPGLFALGFLLVLAAILAGNFGARVVHPVRIDERQTHLKGAGEAFLGSLDATPA